MELKPCPFCRNTEDYAIALQKIIEYYCKDEKIPENIRRYCPYHAKMLEDKSWK
jgi:hypothetical protein